jgi:hypothetical protein
MNKLKNILNEYHNEERLEGKAHRSVPITEEEFLRLKDRHCSKALQGTQLYRGVEGATAKYLFIDPSKHTRVSQYTKNWYMLLMELSSEWKEYPKFSKSVIMTTKEDHSSTWGREYKVYPFNGAKLGVTPNIHFWGSFDYDMDTLTSFMETVFNEFGLNLDNNETNPQKLTELFNKIDKRDRSFKEDAKKRIWENDFYDGSEEFNEALLRLIRGDKALQIFCDLLPTHNFTLKSIGDKLPIGKEVWTDSPCILEKVGEEDE